MYYDKRHRPIYVRPHFWGKHSRNGRKIDYVETVFPTIKTITKKSGRGTVSSISVVIMFVIFIISSYVYNFTGITGMLTLLFLREKTHKLCIPPNARKTSGNFPFWNKNYDYFI